MIQHHMRLVRTPISARDLESSVRGTWASLRWRLIHAYRKNQSHWHGQSLANMFKIRLCSTSLFLSYMRPSMPCLSQAHSRRWLVLQEMSHFNASKGPPLVYG